MNVTLSSRGFNQGLSKQGQITVYDIRIRGASL